MMLLKEWIKTIDKEEFKKNQEHFFRDPVRPMFHNDSLFFAPADGVVLYTYLGKDKLFDIKGKSFTIKELTGLELGKVMVVGVFMTQWSVHVNRVPYSGTLRYWELPPLKTKNFPMLHEEQDLLKGIVKHQDMEYLFYNERVINRITTKLGFDYYVVQIGDYDVDTITPFFIKQNQPVFQGERFSMIRFGSQLDLVIPVLPQYKYEFLTGPMMYVEAGKDPLIKIERKNK